MSEPVNHIAELIDANTKIALAHHRADGEAGPLQRAQHRKHHGCATARFTVDPGISERFAHGVFREPGRTFDALIRFSNGNERDDRHSDAHGMAIKLLGVTGMRLTGDEWLTVQDFVLADHETFFSKSIPTIAVLNTDLAKTAEAQADHDWLRELHSKAELIADIAASGDLGLLPRLKRFTSGHPASPLSTDYWSVTPYKLGDDAVKYKVSCASCRDVTDPDPLGPDHLRAALTRELANGPARFDFLVLPRDDEARQPIEDPTVAWSEFGTPPIRIATIEIPRQDIAANAQKAERLVFSPWNCLAAHEPLGQINAARRHVYTALSGTRHAQDSAAADNNFGRKKWANGG